MTERTTVHTFHTHRVPASPRGWPRLAAAAYVLSVVIMGTNMPSPLYELYGRQFGFGASMVTFLVGIYALVLLPTLILCGSLADAVGYRAVVLPALGAATAGTLVFAFAANAWWLLAARILQALAVGAASGALAAALATTQPLGNQSTAALLTSTMTAGGAGAGPILAGLLAQYAPAPRMLCYFIEAGLLAVAGIAATTLPARPDHHTRWRPRYPRIPGASRAAFTSAAGVSFLSWAVAYIVLALAPSYLAALLHTDNLLLAGTAAGELLLGAAAAQLMCRRWDATRAQVAGLCLLATGLTGLVAVGFIANLSLLLAAIAIAGTGQGLAFMGATRQATSLTPSGQRAETAAAFWVASYLGGGLPVIGVGVASTRFGLTHAVQAFAAALAVACLATFAVVRRREHRRLPACIGRGSSAPRSGANCAEQAVVSALPECADLTEAGVVERGDVGGKV